MSDILDSYISRIDISSFSKKINYYIDRIKFQKNRIIKTFTLRFEIFKTKLELKFDYIKLGKFISKNYNQDNIIDFSYQEDFFLLNQNIGRKERYIEKLKNNIKNNV